MFYLYRLLCLVVGVEIFLDLLGLTIAPIPGLSAEAKGTALFWILLLSALWNAAETAGAVFVPLPPGINEQKRRTGIVFSAIGTGVVGFGLFLTWVPMGVPSGVLTVVLMAILALALIADIIAARYLVRA